MSEPLIAKRQNIITANIVATTTTSGVNKQLTLKEQCKTGNKFSIVDGKIVIGSGVKKVLVSAKALLDDTQLTNSFLYLGHNGNIINRGDVYGIYSSISLPAMLVEVNEGDTFTLSVTTGTNAIIHDGTYMTVEVIE